MRLFTPGETLQSPRTRLLFPPNAKLFYRVMLLLLSSVIFGNLSAQESFEEKREMRRNLVVKELNADAKGRRQWLDHLTVWDENGYKIEEIEYAVYGQRERVTFEYDASGRCIRENVYNDKNKLYRIRKYEYLENGRKKMQYNYNPDGKLYSTKIYEYSYK